MIIITWGCSCFDGGLSLRHISTEDEGLLFSVMAKTFCILCMQYFNGLVARFLNVCCYVHIIIYKFKNGSLLGQMDEAYILGQWVIRVTKCGSVGCFCVYFITL